MADFENNEEEEVKQIDSWKIKDIPGGKQVEVTWSDNSITIHKTGDENVPEEVKRIAPSVFKTPVKPIKSQGKFFFITKFLLVSNKSKIEKEENQKNKIEKKNSVIESDKNKNIEKVDGVNNNEAKDNLLLEKEIKQASVEENKEHITSIKKQDSNVNKEQVPSIKKQDSKIKTEEPGIKSQHSQEKKIEKVEENGKGGDTHRELEKIDEESDVVSLEVSEHEEEENKIEEKK